MLLTWFINAVPITAKNPRANAIVERMHQVLGNMLRAQLTKQHDKEDPVKDLTSAAAYAIRSTVHGVTGFTPGQVVYNRDMIVRTPVQPDLDSIKQRRAAAVEVNNAKENRRRIQHTYKPGDKILIIAGGLDPKLKLHSGPYKVLSYDENSGTLRIQRRNYVDSINIRNVRPYFGS
jgi:hypothetical protein